MTHNVTLPLRSCLHNQKGRVGVGVGGGSGSGSSKGEEGYRIKVVEE